MIELKDFQRKASEEIAEKLNKYLENPLGGRNKNSIHPFYQNLSAITGAGKTVILADAAETIRAYLTTEPVVLWISKGKVVVSQTISNLSNKYSNLIPNFEVMPLLDCMEKDLLDERALLLVATVGKFNQRDKEEGDRRIFQTGLDNANESLWELIKQRVSSDGKKRDLIIIYDEVHNLSDQQTSLLLELEPTALISASATSKIPQNLSYEIMRLKKEKQYSDRDLVTSVSNADVVESKLIKKNIEVGGYLSDMEIAIDEMLDDLKDTKLVAKDLDIDINFKAIYVCDTNMLSKTNEHDNTSVPFSDRKARPIKIWNYLVNQKGISPENIAVYCNLKFIKEFPPPSNFNLFNGGDNDYNDFTQGDFQHIIFNKSLQEGWDDPECYFAYIDKDMGSTTQVTQVIGRVLRQPGGIRYSDERLNTASFYIKTDEKNVFGEIVEEINTTLMVDVPDVNLIVRQSEGAGTIRSNLSPKEERSLPDMPIISDDAKKEIDKIMGSLIDYRSDVLNTVGVGRSYKVKSEIGSGVSGIIREDELTRSNEVTARWVLKRELDKYAKRASALCDISDPKLDAKVDYSSNAAKNIRETAVKIADAYYEHSYVVANSDDCEKVGNIKVDKAKLIRFDNALFEGFSSLNDFEKKFAVQLDKNALVWMKNPDTGFFEIPLLDKESSKNFNPDFIIWKNKELILVDTKGNHLLETDKRRKLFDINDICGGIKINVRLLSEGQVDEHLNIKNKDGYTVWALKHGKPFPYNFDTLEDACEHIIKN